VISGQTLADADPAKLYTDSGLVRPATHAVTHVRTGHAQAIHVVEAIGTLTDTAERRWYTGPVRAVEPGTCHIGSHIVHELANFVRVKEEPVATNALGRPFLCLRTEAVFAGEQATWSRAVHALANDPKGIDVCEMLVIGTVTNRLTVQDHAGPGPTGNQTAQFLAKVVHVAFAVHTQVIPSGTEADTSIAGQNTHSAHAAYHPIARISGHGLADVASVIVLTVRAVAPRTNGRHQTCLSTAVHALAIGIGQFAAHPVASLNVTVLAHAPTKRINHHIDAMPIARAVRRAFKTRVVHVMPARLASAYARRIVRHDLTGAVLAA